MHKFLCIFQIGKKLRTKIWTEKMHFMINDFRLLLITFELLLISNLSLWNIYKYHTTINTVAENQNSMFHFKEEKLKKWFWTWNLLKLFCLKQRKAELNSFLFHKRSNVMRFAYLAITKAVPGFILNRRKKCRISIGFQQDSCVFTFAIDTLVYLYDAEF